MRLISIGWLLLVTVTVTVADQNELEGLRFKYQVGREQLQKPLTPLRAQYKARLLERQEEIMDAGALAKALAAKEAASAGDPDPKEVEIKKHASNQAIEEAGSGAIAEGAMERNGHFYFMFDEMLTGKEAEARCEKLHGHLVTLSDKGESDFVRKITRSKNGGFGASDEEAEGKWRWVTGEPFTFTDW